MIRHTADGEAYEPFEFLTQRLYETKTELWHQFCFQAGLNI